MKYLRRIFAYSSFFLLFTAAVCDPIDDIAPTACDAYLESLSTLEFEIENLASSSECGDEFECRAIAYGSKACGGPREYLVYSTSIDTLLLQNLVEEFNSIENDYNLECDGTSDCLAVTPPTGFICENNSCVATFD